MTIKTEKLFEFSNSLGEKGGQQKENENESPDFDGINNGEVIDFFEYRGNKILRFLDSIIKPMLISDLNKIRTFLILLRDILIDSNYNYLLSDSKFQQDYEQIVDIINRDVDFIKKSILELEEIVKQEIKVKQTSGFSKTFFRKLPRVLSFTSIFLENSLSRLIALLKIYIGKEDLNKLLDNVIMLVFGVDEELEQIIVKKRDSLFLDKDDKSRRMFMRFGLPEGKRLFDFIMGFKFE